MAKVLVCGAGGFIGSHLVRRLKRDGHWVRGVDLKRPEFSPSAADEFVLGDLRDPRVAGQAVLGMSEVFQLAAEMGGAGFIFTGDNDFAIMHSSALINLNVLGASVASSSGIQKIFFSSSACIYPERNQLDPASPLCTEDSAYPAAPDSEYGWEKLFSERLYLDAQRNHGIAVRIARFHNVFGPEGTWCGGREKAPAAICRKVAEASDGGALEIWGDGRQTRSFLYVDECIEGVMRLMCSNFPGPVNIGSDEMVAVNDLVRIVAGLANKQVAIRHIPGPTGVRGRTSDNRLIAARLGWQPSAKLSDGLAVTYEWIRKQAEDAKDLAVLPQSA